MRLPKGRSVWVLDGDNEGRHEIVKKMAEDGIQAVGHRSVDEHYEALRHSVPLCLVTDYHAGTNHGLSVIETTRERSWPLPAILVAKDLSIPLVTKAFRSGCYAVLPKPIDLSQLRIEIHDAIRMGAKAVAEYERQSEANSRFSDLTPHQRLVLREMLLGSRNKCIAERLGISLRTVDNRKHEIFQTLGVENLAGLFDVVRLIRPDHFSNGTLGPLGIQPVDRDPPHLEPAFPRPHLLSRRVGVV